MIGSVQLTLGDDRTVRGTRAQRRILTYLKWLLGITLARCCAHYHLFRAWHA